jgi:hypothetical protein
MAWSGHRSVDQRWRAVGQRRDERWRERQPDLQGALAVQASHDAGDDPTGHRAAQVRQMGAAAPPTVKVFGAEGDQAIAMHDQAPVAHLSHRVLPPAADLAAGGGVPEVGPGPATTGSCAGIAVARSRQRVRCPAAK